MIGSNNKQNTIKTSSDLTSSNNVVTVPAGTYLTDATITVGSALAAKTYNTSTSNQTIAAGKYLTGKQTIRAVTTSGIEAANIKKDVVIKVGDSASAGRIKNVTGTYEGAEGVGISTINSYIRVTYPEGATCICVNGTTTITAPNTCGNVAFAIPNTGDWIITITQTGYPTQSKTQNVVANTIYDIKLIFDLVLYDTGDENTSITGGWIAGHETEYGHVTSTIPTLVKENTYMHIYGNLNGNVSTTNYIDLTNYDYIDVDYEMVAAQSNSSYNRLIFFSETHGFIFNGNYELEIHEDLTIGRHTIHINISNLVGSYRIAYFLYANTDFRVYSIIASQNREQITVGAGYQRIEYITSATKTVIDTGIYMQADMSVIANIMMGRAGSDASYDFHVLSRYNDNKYSYFAMIYRDRYTYSGLNGGGYSPSMAGQKGPRQITLNVKYEFTCVLKDGIYKSYIDGDLHQYRTNGPVTIASGTDSLLIFAHGYDISNDSAASNSSQNRIYSMKIYQRDNLVRNFVPCYRISDSKIGLWDMVSQQFFQNPLSGTFIGGPDINE